MALTRITKGVIKPNENYDTHNINSTGIITAIGFKGPFTGSSDIQSGIITATQLDLNGDLDVDGHTNLDNVSIAGVTTAAGAIDLNADLDVDGHTNLDNVSIAGVTTFAGAISGTTASFSGNVSIGGTLTYEDVTNVDAVGLVTARTGVVSPYADIDDWIDVGNNIQLGNAGVATATLFNATTGVFAPYADIDDWIDVGNNIQLGNAGIVTAKGADINGDIDVDGHTNLDNVSVAGVTTHNEDVTFTGVTAGRNAFWDKSENSLEFGDYTYAKFGASDDLTIFHSTSPEASLINNKTGELRIVGSGTIRIGKRHDDTGAYAANMIVATPDGSVELHNNNSKKLETSSSGVTVTGALTATSFVGALPISNGANNRVITATGANALTGESNLTFDGNQLFVTTGGSSDPLIVNSTYANRKSIIRETSDANANAGLTIQKKHSTLHPNGYWYGDIRFEGWDGDQYRRAALIECVAEGTPANDNMPGQLRIHTNPGQASQEERIRITKDGSVNIGGDYTQTSKKFKVTGNSTFDGGLLVTGLLEGGSGFSIINGNLTLPAYIYHDGDSDTYYGFSGANEFSIFTGGAQRLRVQNDGNIRWFPDGANGVNLYATSGTNSIVLSANKNGAVGTTWHFKNQNSSGQAQTWMEITDNQNMHIPYSMGGTDKLNIYTGSDAATKGITITGQDGNNQNSDAGVIRFNGYGQTNGPWIQGKNVQAWGQKDLIIGTRTTANDYSTQLAETIRFTRSGQIGVNQSSPQYLMHISSTSSSGTQRVDLHMTNATTGHLGSDGVQFGYQNTAGAYIWNFESTPVYIGTSNKKVFEVQAAQTQNYSGGSADNYYADFRVVHKTPYSTDGGYPGGTQTATNQTVFSLYNTSYGGNKMAFRSGQGNQFEIETKTRDVNSGSYNDADVYFRSQFDATITDRYMIGTYGSHSFKSRSKETFGIGSGGDIWFGENPYNTQWAATNAGGWYYREDQTSMIVASRAATGYSTFYINKNTGSGSSDTRWIDFYWNASQYGRISYNGASGTVYGTSSDYRLKENAVSITDGIAKVKQLKPYRFNFKSDTTDKVVQGFFAHEAQEVVPYAVTGTKDEVVTQEAFDEGSQPEEKAVGDPIYQDVDYAKFTPILTAALQEAIAKIEILEAKVAALEGS